MSVKLRAKKLKDGGKSYYLDIYHNSERTYEFLGIKTILKGKNKDSTLQRNEKKRVAEEKAAQREIELISTGSSYLPKHVKNINFNDFGDAFLKRYTKKDIRIVTAAYNKFVEFIDKDRFKVAEITPNIMEQFKEHLINNSGLTGETAHNYFTRFKKILKSAKIKGIIREMPTTDIRFSNPNKKEDTLAKEILEIDELRKLANTYCGNNEVKKAFLFCCYTGLGLAETKNLTWNQIKKDRIVINRKKTGTEINNQLNPVALKLIGEPKGNKDTVFNLNNISDTAVNKNLKNWLKRAEINKKITFYCARHSFACLLLMNGANLKSVADAMGHATTKTTLKYLNHVEKLKDQAINNLPDIEL